MGIYKFGNKYLSSAYKTQFKFRSHFLGKKVCLLGWEIWYLKSGTRQNKQFGTRIGHPMQAAERLEFK
jgi:hypothetical protein